MPLSCITDYNQFIAAIKSLNFIACFIAPNKTEVFNKDLYIPCVVVVMKSRIIEPYTNSSIKGNSNVVPRP